MPLAELLHRDRNNLDLFRLIAACMVIMAHAYPLSGLPQGDWVLKLLGHDNAGSLAVKLFFFLSGLVVTASLLNKADPIRFILARFFRIWPAMLLAVSACALLIGPLISSLSPVDYFASPLTYRYLLDNLLLNTHFTLPGVFEQNPYTGVVNGSLWTIPYEVAAYAILLGLFAAGLFRLKGAPLLAFLLILIDPLLEEPLLFSWLPDNHHVTMLAPCFAFGSLLAYYRDRLTMNMPLILGAWLLYALCRNTPVNFYFFYFALFLSVIFVSALPAVLKARPPVDISFGVYLWAFPIQQLLALYFSDYGLAFNQFCTLLICIPLGLLSWTLVEKPGIALGARFAARLPDLQRSAGTSIH
ncbi:acyltransferase family protein [Stutzerimonas nitrititolerans]|uniref:acyltransferase family protein n=1 Tax=Stutzerimonas nitrititolerans TaxID=2482751 RepID=UPI0028994A1D|nr:acyltransferase [Stutzerimonas nitrititolerans]